MSTNVGVVNSIKKLRNIKEEIFRTPFWILLNHFHVYVYLLFCFIKYDIILLLFVIIFLSYLIAYFISLFVCFLFLHLPVNTYFSMITISTCTYDLIFDQNYVNWTVFVWKKIKLVHKCLTRPQYFIIIPKKCCMSLCFCANIFLSSLTLACKPSNVIFYYFSYLLSLNNRARCYLIFLSSLNKKRTYNFTR